MGLIESLDLSSSQPAMQGTKGYVVVNDYVHHRAHLVSTSDESSSGGLPPSSYELAAKVAENDNSYI